MLAIIVAIATVFAAVGAVTQGFAAYNEWACKVLEVDGMFAAITNRPLRRNSLR